MDPLKTAFDPIRAEDALRTNTLAYVEKRRRHPQRAWQMAVAAACCLVLLLSSAWLYFTPTAQISIDMNVPLTLEVNRFDRIVSASSSGSQSVLSDLELTHLAYSDAMEQILSSDAVTTLLADGEIMTVSVIAPEGEQSDRLMSETRNRTDAHCYYADPETAQEAAHTGLSWSKYRAWQELQALDPSITAEDVRCMTMRQIRDWIDVLSQTASSPTESPDAPTTEPTAQPTELPTAPGHHGQGNGNGTGNGHGHGKQ